MFLSAPDVKKATSREKLEVLYVKALETELDQQGEVTWIEYGKDVELLPIKAMSYMQQAELILYDQECPFAVVDLCRRDAEREVYSNAAELGERLKSAQEEKLRVCVLMFRSTREYSLLQNHQRVIYPGSEK